MSEALAKMAQMAIKELAEPQNDNQVIVQQVFVLLHGFYGNGFLSKFATGLLDADGRDKGVKSAKMVWQSSLKKYDMDTIKAAVEMCKTKCIDFPPSLPKFLEFCEALKKRETQFRNDMVRICHKFDSPFARSVRAAYEQSKGKK